MALSIISVGNVLPGHPLGTIFHGCARAASWFRVLGFRPSRARQRLGVGLRWVFKLGGEPENRTFAGFALKPNLPFHQDHDLLRNHEAFEIAAL
jgi:hypothetical protein